MDEFRAAAWVKDRTERGPAGPPRRVFHYSVVLGTPHSLVDLYAIAPFLRRQGHYCLMDRGINRQRAIERLFGPCPRDRKRLCPRGLDPRRSSHFAPRFLICLKIRIAGSPSRTIFARLRSLAGNIIALTTAERSFIVP